MAKEIALTQGKVAIVSDEDYEWLAQLNWHVMSRGYAHHNRYGLMHRAIMHRTGHDLTGLVVDHINRDQLDNRRENLRVVTQRENLRNQNGQGAIFRGVYWSKYSHNWQVRVRESVKLPSLGSYESPVIAAVFANDFLRERDGAFARLNDIPFSVEMLARQVPTKQRRKRTTEEIIAQLEHAERVERAYSEYIIMKRITEWQAQHTASPANEAAVSTGEAA